MWVMSNVGMEPSLFLVFSSNLYAGLRHPALFIYHIDINTDVIKFAGQARISGRTGMVIYNLWAYIAIFRSFPDRARRRNSPLENMRQTEEEVLLAGWDLLLEGFSGRGQVLRGASVQARQRKFSPVYGRHRRRPCRDTGPRPSWSQRSWLLTTSILTVSP